MQPKLEILEKSLQKQLSTTTKVIITIQLLFISYNEYYFLWFLSRAWLLFIKFFSFQLYHM